MNLLGRAINEFEMAVGKENGSGYARKTATCAQVQNGASWLETQSLGNGQRVKDMMLIQVVDIFARDNIDTGVPRPIQFVKLTYLFYLTGAKVGKILQYLVHNGMAVNGVC